MALTGLKWIFSESKLFNLTLKVKDSQMECLERCLIADTLEANASIHLILVFLSTVEINDFETMFAFITAEKVFKTLSLSIDVTKKQPMFTISPNGGFNFRLTNNQKLFFEFDITNTGTLTATNLNVTMPQFQLKSSFIELNLIEIVCQNESNQTTVWVRRHFVFFVGYF